MEEALWTGIGDKRYCDLAQLNSCNVVECLQMTDDVCNGILTTNQNDHVRALMLVEDIPYNIDTFGRAFYVNKQYFLFVVMFEYEVC